jgi:hypothetical protein
MPGAQCSTRLFIKCVQRLADQVDLATAAVIQPG